MNHSKNTITLALMISSLLLLLMLQGLWLKNSYERAFFDLRRETSGIFRSTIFSMRDSMLVHSIQRVDTSKAGDHFLFNRKVDSIFVNRQATPAKMKTESSQVQIYISSNRSTDSIQKVIRPLAMQVQEGRVKGGGTFVLRIGGDSLSTDSIRMTYKKALIEAGYDVPFEVNFMAPLPSPLDFKNIRTTGFRPPELWEDSVAANVFANSMKSEWVRFDPIHHYSVDLTDIRPLIIKEIIPQIFFSIFLTLITTIAFVVMYRSIRNQQKLMRLKNELISNITHELKTPITTVGVAIEALRNFKGINNPEVTDEYLAIAQNELNRLSILAEKVLRTAIHEDKGVEFKPEPVELNKIIEQAIGSMKLVFEKQDAKVSFEKTGSDFNMMGSNIHLTSVIYNLLDNALKYSPRNPEIKISLKEEANSLLLSVKDNGMGIPAEYQKKIFEKFFRVPTGDVHNIKGYGLGLSYVESVVKSHKGTIKVESEPGNGSNFVISLPKQL